MSFKLTDQRTFQLRVAPTPYLFCKTGYKNNLVNKSPINLKEVLNMRKLSLSVKGLLIAVFLIMALIFLSPGVSFSQGTTESDISALGQGLGDAINAFATCIDGCTTPTASNFQQAQDCISSCSFDVLGVELQAILK